MWRHTTPQPSEHSSRANSISAALNCHFYCGARLPWVGFTGAGRTTSSIQARAPRSQPHNAMPGWALQPAAVLLLLACCLQREAAALREGPARAHGAPRRLTDDDAALLSGEAHDPAHAATEAATAAALTADAATQLQPFTSELPEGASAPASGEEAVGASAPDFRAGSIRRRRAKARRGAPRLLRPGYAADRQADAGRPAWDPAQAAVAPPRSAGPWQARPCRASLALCCFESGACSSRARFRALP